MNWTASSRFYANTQKWWCKKDIIITWCIPKDAFSYDWIWIRKKTLLQLIYLYPIILNMVDLWPYIYQNILKHSSTLEAREILNKWYSIKVNRQNTLMHNMLELQYFNNTLLHQILQYSSILTLLLHHQGPTSAIRDSSDEDWERPLFLSLLIETLFLEISSPEPFLVQTQVEVWIFQQQNDAWQH